MRFIEPGKAPDIFNQCLKRGRYTGAELRLFCVQVDRTTTALTGACTLLSGGTSTKPILHVYGPVKFYRATISTGKVKQLVNGLQKGEELSFPKLGKCWVKGAWGQGAYLATGERYSHATAGWPCFFWEASLDIPNDAAQAVSQCRYKQLNGQGPLYPDVETAVLHQIFGVDDVPPGSRYENHFHILLPDFRGRIKSTTLNWPAVEFNIERGRNAPSESLMLDIYVLSSAGTRHAKVPVEVDKAHLEVDGTLKRLLAHLVWRNETLDEIEADLRFGRARDPRLHLSPTQRRLVIEGAIAAGEGLRSEFKLRLGSKDDNRDFVESIAAFANTEGGLIVLGVDDNANVVGYAPPKAHETIANIIADRCDPRPEFHIERVELTSPVTVIEVQPGPHPLYLADGIPFIRVDGTDRRMSAAEMHACLQRRRGQ